MQDDIQLNGFVNCITRNLSVRRGWFETHGGFDEAFSYSASATEPGFGWEDVELGFRLYESGAKISYTPAAISLHQSHASSVAEEVQIRGSATNFDKLNIRHPDLRKVARRWSTDTALRIQQWADQAEVKSPALESIARRFEKPLQENGPFIRIWRRSHRRLRIVTHRWHVPHQFEIYKLPHDFTLLTNTGTHFVDKWETRQRRQPANIRFLDANEYNPADYDMAIMHFDENVLAPDLSNGTLGSDWGATFKWFLKNVDLPKVAVCHGTPPFVGQYGANQRPLKRFEVYDYERLRLVEALKDVEVVCNSWQAQEEWQFARSRVIWHGLDPQQFPPGNGGAGIVSHGLDTHRPHYRGFHILKDVLRQLDGQMPVATHAHKGVTGIHANHPYYATESFRCWVNHLRRFDIYLNTTLRSPMPRSRTEAMLSNLVPVTLRNHDAEAFIDHGVNGFLADNADELLASLRFLHNNPKTMRRIGRAARQTALELFNHDRFLSEWVQMLDGYTS